MYTQSILYHMKAAQFVPVLFSAQTRCELTTLKIFVFQSTKLQYFCNTMKFKCLWNDTGLLDITTQQNDQWKSNLHKQKTISWLLNNWTIQYHNHLYQKNWNTINVSSKDGAVSKLGTKWVVIYEELSTLNYVFQTTSCIIFLCVH